MMKQERERCLMYRLHFHIAVGLAGTLATLVYGAYAYRFRGPMSTSRYLMRLRVVAQGMAVGSMIIGAVLVSNLK